MRCLIQAFAAMHADEVSKLYRHNIVSLNATVASWSRHGCLPEMKDVVTLKAITILVAACSLLKPTLVC